MNVLDPRGDQAFTDEATSSSLLDRVCLREEEAWSRLLTLYGPLVWDWCGRWQLNPHDREEVVQEVFQAVHRNVDSFQKSAPGDSFRAWLWTITRNKLRDRFRRMKHQITADGGSEGQMRLEQVPEELSESAEQPLVASAKEQILARALEMLRPRFEGKTWDAFWRSTIEGHTPQQIAADLDMSAGAVYQAKSRVLRYLRRELEGLIEL